MAKLVTVGRAHEASAADAPFTWFLYGSSLDRAAFAAWAEQHGYGLPDFKGAVPAKLSGYRLCFDGESRFWGGACGSLTEDASSFVEGLALPLPAEARGLVEHKEGAISGLYAAFPCELTPLSGGAPIAAVAYRTSPDRRLPKEAPPSVRWLQAVRDGARSAGLSEAWLAQLSKLAG